MAGLYFKGSQNVAGAIFGLVHYENRSRQHMPPNSSVDFPSTGQGPLRICVTVSEKDLSRRQTVSIAGLIDVCFGPVVLLSLQQ